jgi:hypothetical protein
MRPSRPTPAGTCIAIDQASSMTVGAGLAAAGGVVASSLTFILTAMACALSDSIGNVRATGAPAGCPASLMASALHNLCHAARAE